MTKIIMRSLMALFFVITAMGFMACQRQGSTNGRFFDNDMSRVLGEPYATPSQFNWSMDTQTKKGHAELIIYYAEDRISVSKKYTFDFTLDQVSSQAKGNDVIYGVVDSSNEDPAIQAHMTITDTPDYREKALSIETWVITKSKVTLFKMDPTIILEPDISLGVPLIANSEHASDKLIGEHNGKSEALESTESKKSSSERDREEQHYQRRFDPKRPLK